MQRIRGRKLQRIRAAHFLRFPLCVKCEARGHVSLATQLDHIVPLFKGGADVDENRQGLCDECHEDKTRRDLGQVDWSGADTSGRPMSPKHHWNR